MNILPVYDSGYRGREVRIGFFNPQTKTFVKRVKYPQHFMFKYTGWGYSEASLERLRQLSCRKLKHIESVGCEERVWVTDFSNYLNSDIYVRDVDDLRGRENKPDRRTDFLGRMHRDVQRFVDVKYWRRK